MSKVALYYFTGTGNSRLHAEKVVDGLKQAGIGANPFNVSDNPQPPDGFDMVGIVFPVYCWAPPWPLTRWVRQQVGLEGKPMFVLANFAGDAANALQKLSKTLKARGAKLFEFGHTLSPEAWTVPRTPRLAKTMDEQYEKEKGLHDQSFEFGGRVAYRIAKGDFQESWPKFRASGWELIVPFYRPGALWATYKMRVDKNKCTRCGICENMCPTHSIKLGPYPTFTRPCAACYGCINLCPAEALETSFTKGKVRYSKPFI